MVTNSGHFRDVAFGDLNRDGMEDIAAGSSDNLGLKVFLAGSGRTWSEASGNLPAGGNFNGIALKDVNHDGRLDIIAGSSDGAGIRVYLRSDENLWTESSSGLPSADFVCNEVLVADFNRDGNLDIAATSGDDHGLRIYTGNGAGAWTEQTAPATTGSWTGIAAWDWTGNGCLDFIAASQSEQGLGFWRHGAFFNYVFGDFELPRVGSFQQLALTDANFDGRQDVVATFQMGVRAFSGIEPPFPEISTGLPSGQAFAGLVAGNQPRDAQPDIFFSSGENPGLFGFKGLVRGAWLLQEDFQSTGTFPGLAMADSDRDGASDLAGASHKGGIQIYYFEPTHVDVDYTSGTAPVKPAVSDV